MLLVVDVAFFSSLLLYAPTSYPPTRRRRSMSPDPDRPTKRRQQRPSLPSRFLPKELAAFSSSSSSSLPPHSHEPAKISSRPITRFKYALVCVCVYMNNPSSLSLYLSYSTSPSSRFCCWRRHITIFVTILWRLYTKDDRSLPRSLPQFINIRRLFRRAPPFLPAQHYRGERNPSLWWSKDKMEHLIPSSSPAAAADADPLLPPHSYT